MSLSPDLALFGAAFVTMLVIMDPLGNLPVFLSLTRSYSTGHRNRAAAQASLVAGGIIGVFALTGDRVLALLGISLPALQVAGGLLLLLIALELLRGHDSGAERDGSEPNLAFVPLGTPLLAGPGAIATTILFVKRADGLGGVLSVVLALVAVLVVVYLSMRFAGLVVRVLRDNGIHLLSRVMGLLVAAIAAQTVATAVQSWIVHGVH